MKYHGMKYADLQRLYPRIWELFAQVADQIDDGRPDAAIMPMLMLRVEAEIRRSHRKDITDKLLDFAKRVREARALEQREHPSEACRICGSIEISDGVCRWCHNE